VADAAPGAASFNHAYREEDAVTDAVVSTAASPGLLAGHAVIARIRRLLIVTVIAGFAYGTFTAAGAAGCAGGYDGNGGYLDGAGRATDAVPTCMELTLRPSPFVFIAIGLIVVLAIGRVLKATDEQIALRTLDRAATGIVALVVIAIVVSHVWFQLVPLHDLVSSDSWTVISPFPFGTIDVSTEPVPGVSG